MLKTLLILTLLVNHNVFQEKRQLLIFANNAANKTLKLQKQWLKADPNGLKERDVDIKYYFADEDKARFKQKNVKLAFTVILVGKDGGDKLKSTKPITLAKLYNTIDAMPMRQSEMKQYP